MIRIIFLPFLLACAGLFSTAYAETCPDAFNTIEIHDCLAKVSGDDQKTLDLYLHAARQQLKKNQQAGYLEKEVIPLFEQAQQQWEAYANTYCDAVYYHWSPGSIAARKMSQCTSALIRQRTLQIWEEFLTFADSTPPILPQP